MPTIEWASPDGKSVQAFTRAPLEAESSLTYFHLAHHLSKTMLQDATACLALLHDEMVRSMGLLGVNTLAELNPSYVRAAPPVRPPHVLSAFPFIDGPDDRY